MVNREVKETPSPAQLTLLTDIMLVVRVPVLSEQITEVQPRVSTEGRLRTMAFLRAILRVPAEREERGGGGRGGGGGGVKCSPWNHQHGLERKQWRGLYRCSV